MIIGLATRKRNFTVKYTKLALVQTLIRSIVQNFK